jgi:hypothetical protein
MGRPRQPGDPHAEGSGALARESNPDRGGILFYPRATSLWPRPHKGGGRAATVARAVQAEAAKGFRPAVAVPGFKSEGGGRGPAVQATNPIGVFPFHST